MGSTGRVQRGTAVLVWYRTQTTLRARLGGYLTLIALVGLVGGVAMASVAAARRTDSSYPRFLATTDPSDFFVQPTTTGSADCGTRFFTQLTQLAHVRKVECATALNAAALTRSGKLKAVLITQVELVASSDGLFSDLDRVTLTAGRRPDKTSLDEVIANPEAAALFDLHVGSRLKVGIDTNAQQHILPPYRTLELRVVGLGAFNHQVVQDDIDKDHTGFLLGSPALARQFSSCCSSVPYDAIAVAGDAGDVASVGHEYAALVQRVNPANPQLLIYQSSVNETAAQRAIRPQAIALGVFGAIAGLATLVIGSIALARHLAAGRDDLEVLRALGAGPGATMADGLPGLGAAIVVGTLLAAALALLLSPITDFGPVSSLDPARGWNADWAVLGLGVLALVLALGGVAVLVAFRQAPHRATAHQEEDRSGTRVARRAAAMGLPVVALAGLRFAVEPGRGRTAVPVRSTIAGTVLAITVLVATVTFGASLGTLISHPSLYGWNFDDALFSTDGFGPLPTAVFRPLLARDHQIGATTGIYFGNYSVDGMTVPAIAIPPRAPIEPRTLTGHRLETAHQIVLGSATLAALHRRLGQTVVVTGDGLPPTRLTVVGTAALPAIGQTLSTHSSMSTGALFPTSAVPPGLLNAGIPPQFAGPNALLVRFKPGVNPLSGRHSLQKVVDVFLKEARSPAILAASGGSSAYLTVETLSVQRPAEIVNYRSMGTTPGILAGALAFGTVVALALTLVASVRRRRRDFAVLKTLGFTARQLAATVAWQASVIAFVGLVLGSPLGIVSGRWLWELFARELSVVFDPTVPALLLVVIGVAAVVLANLVAALPGRIAARTPAAMVLRSE